jgi:DNA-binding NarL/FixJ family response regulator
MQVVAEAGDGQQACQVALAAQPDVAVIDINMPVLDGVQVTRHLTLADPDLGVIILTMYRHDEYVFEAIKAGARAFLLKDADSDELLQAIRVVSVGEALLSPAIARKMVEEFRRLQRQRGEDDSLSSLAKIEMDILRLVAQGLSNKNIGDRLGLAEKTVRNRLSVVFHKLHVNNRVQAARYALRHGLASLDEEDT